MRRHPLDPVSLLAGLLFTGLSISLLTGSVTARTQHLTLVWAVGAVLVGLGLLASGRRSQQGPVEAAPQTEAQTGPQTGTQTGPQTEHGTAGEIRED
jgi:hypothetical protein